MSSRRVTLLWLHHAWFRCGVETCRPCVARPRKAQNQGGWQGNPWAGGENTLLIDSAVEWVQCGMQLYADMATPMLISLHHVQIAMPAGQEDRAIGYYCTLLGFAQDAKPPSLSGRGGAWFRNGAIRVHLGVETPFVPAKKAHPAFVVGDLDALAHRLSKAGYGCDWDDKLPDFRRFYSADPFGNRIEFMQPRTI